MQRLILTLAAAAALCGCVKVDKSPPKDLPDYVTLYPGAQPTMSMKMGPLSAEVLTTTDKPDDVIAYYRNQAAAEGLTETAAKTPAVSAAGEVQAAFTDATGSKLLVVLAKPQGSSTMVDLTYKPAPKAGS